MVVALELQCSSLQGIGPLPVECLEDYGFSAQPLQPLIITRGGTITAPTGLPACLIVTDYCVFDYTVCEAATAI
jgi:hypothetical protein